VYLKAKNIVKETKWGPQPPPTPQAKESSPISQTIVLELNVANKSDLMSFGNLLLQHKKVTTFDYLRQHSDKRKVTEVYALPSQMIIDYQTLQQITKKLELHLPANDLKIQIKQNVDMKLVCEVLGTEENLQDVQIREAKGVRKVSWNEFRRMYSKCSPYGFPVFRFESDDVRWNSNPEHFLNGQCESILTYIYATKNYSLFDKFVQFLLHGETFDYYGAQYQLTDSSSPLGEKFKKEELYEKFKVELKQYCEALESNLQGQSPPITDWVEEKKQYFEPVNTDSVAVSLTLNSQHSSKDSLLQFSRELMGALINSYYRQSESASGGLITVYQLEIGYNIELVKKENPKHRKWELKYGEDVEKESKKKETESKEGKKPDKEGEAAASSKETLSKEAVPQVPSAPQAGWDSYAYPHYPTRGYGTYPPVEPAKFIEEEVKTPEPRATRIKEDRKPFQYLYLPKGDYEELEGYLANFKDNQQLYEQMGITHKGGILLSGHPGCGKSSTILAAASYLNKNIYYVDLGKFKTNKEFMLCVNYVQTNTQNGGIIIFEDIDCMTPIVHKRGSNNEAEDNFNNLDVQGNDKLSLSTVLNILDGPMSPRDIIFIMTTNHPEKLDPALIRPGRMDLSITIRKCAREQLVKIYSDLYQEELSVELLQRFPEAKYTTSQIILHLFHGVRKKNLPAAVRLQKFLND
jgi:hypothetical protein